MDGNHLVVENLKKYYPLRVPIFSRAQSYVYAVDGVSFDVKRGETLALVGESGCGKTTVGLSILRLIEPTDGKVYLGGVNLLEMGPKEMRPLRRKMQIIFQDPFASLNPWATVAEIVGEGLEIHGISKGQEKEESRHEMQGKRSKGKNAGGCKSEEVLTPQSEDAMTQRCDDKQNSEAPS